MKYKVDLTKIRLGKHFTAHEFANKKDGGAIEVPNPELFQKLDALREIVGAVTITSGYRTKDYNRKVGGSYNSYHLKGLAADIRFDFADWSKESLIKLIHGLGFGNLGIYMRGDRIDRLHVDIGKPWNSGNGWKKHKSLSYKIYQV